MSATKFVHVSHLRGACVRKPVPVTVSVTGATFRKDLPPLEVVITVHDDGIEIPLDLDADAAITSIRAGRYFRCPPAVAAALNRI